MIVLWQTLEGLIAGVVWIAVIASFRLAGRGRDRSARMMHDQILLLASVGAFLLGGLYFAPAGAAFWLVDRRATDAAQADEGTTTRASGRPASLYVGLASCAVGIAGITAFLLLPTYTTASSELTTPGVSTVTNRTVLQLGLDPRAAMTLTIILALFLTVAIGSVIGTRRQPRGRVVMGVAVIGLLGAMIVGGFTIGIFIAPGVLLAFVAFTISLGESSKATTPSGSQLTT